MNVLLLGNGFDIYHMLPTKYHNFLNVVNFLLKNYIDEMKTVADVLGNNDLHNTDGFLKKCYEKHCESYRKTELDRENVLKILELAKGNIWFSYLSNSFNKDIGWIDFEKEISFVLNKMENFLMQDEVMFLDSHTFDTNDYRYVIRAFAFFFEEIINDLPGKESFYEITDDYKSEYPLGSKNIVINKEKVIKKLSIELDNLAKMLKLYLCCFVEKTLDYIVTEINFERCVAISCIHKTITFNYTNTFEKLYRNQSVIHIHGDVEKEIILGINPNRADELNAVDTSFIAFKKYYQRVVLGTDEGYLNWINRIEQDEKLSLLVFGHSLDITDSDIIKALFTRANEIIILYHNLEAKGSYVANLIKIFGKTEFDAVRRNGHLTFLPLDMDFTDFIRKRADEEYEKIAHQWYLDTTNDGKEVIDII